MCYSQQGICPPTVLLIDVTVFAEMSKIDRMIKRLVVRLRFTATGVLLVSLFERLDLASCYKYP